MVTRYTFQVFVQSKSPRMFTQTVDVPPKNNWSKPEPDDLYRGLGKVETLLYQQGVVPGTSIIITLLKTEFVFNLKGK